MRVRHLGILFVLLSVGLPASSAYAQVELSTAERQAAAEAAYDRGTRAYRGGDYSQAAQWWETANELAPAAAAALQAVRAHQRDGNFLRAATMVIFVREQYGEDQVPERFQTPVERARTEGLEVRVSCEQCELEVDGEREIFRTLFLSANVEHTLAATFEEGPAEERLTGAPGESLDVELVAPDPEPVVAPPAGVAPAPGAPAPDEPSGISPVFFWTGLGLTAATGGVAIWSWVDTLDAAADYEDTPTQEKLDAGRDLELRTTILVIATGVLGAATLTTLFFTDWSGDEEDPSEASLDYFGVAPLAEGGLSVGAGGRF
ncbi:MAG: hypothetical protein JRH11_00505 [Deltaproteobacteria bacterium]|nr:hypothetical protein [Deltaproteobacteria bacterium]